MRARIQTRGVAGTRKSDEKEGVGLIAGSGGSATPLRLFGARGKGESVGGGGDSGGEGERASPAKERRKSKRESGRLAQLRRRRKEK